MNRVIFLATLAIAIAVAHATQEPVNTYQGGPSAATQLAKDTQAIHDKEAEKVRAEKDKADKAAAEAAQKAAEEAAKKAAEEKSASEAHAAAEKAAEDAKKAAAAAHAAANPIPVDNPNHTPYEPELHPFKSAVAVDVCTEYIESHKIDCQIYAVEYSHKHKECGAHTAIDMHDVANVCESVVKDLHVRHGAQMLPDLPAANTPVQAKREWCHAHVVNFQYAFFVEGPALL